jgi:hypothetical protein
VRFTEPSGGTYETLVAAHSRLLGRLCRDIVFHWGFAVEYSLPYLQQFVKDVGWPAIIKGLIPLVEIDINNPLDRGFAGKTTGTVSPGIIWVSKYFQLGVEAVVPINERTSKNVGIRGQVHFFLDDVSPTTMGRPICNWQ